MLAQAVENSVADFHVQRHLRGVLDHQRFNLAECRMRCRDAGLVNYRIERIELGLHAAGFDAPAWWAILAPAKTPPEVLKRMNEEINKALKNPEIAKKLDAQGIDIIGGTPAAADVFIGKQIDIWAKVVKDNGIKAD